MENEGTGGVEDDRVWPGRLGERRRRGPWGRGRLCMRADGDNELGSGNTEVRMLRNIYAEVSRRNEFRRKV